MERQLDITDILRAFEIIRTKGKPLGDEFFYNGLFVQSSYDGYTVIIRNQQVKLTIGFHNTLNFQGGSEQEKDAFARTLLAISQEK